jgi:hypothetical protein
MLTLALQMGRFLERREQKSDDVREPDRIVVEVAISCLKVPSPLPLGGPIGRINCVIYITSICMGATRQSYQILVGKPKGNKQLHSVRKT